MRILKEILIQKGYEKRGNDKFYQICNKSLERKKKIFKWLFNNKNTITLKITNSDYQSSIRRHPITRDIENAIDRLNIEGLIDYNLANNTITINKNRHKLSRFVNKSIIPHNSKLKPNYMKLISKYSTLYNKIFLSQDFSQLLLLRNLTLKIRNFDNEINEIDFQKYYSEIKQGNINISILPEDYIMSSTKCAFSSCLRENGEFHEGVYQYLLDDYTIVVMARQDEITIGRQFIYINDYNIAYGRIYGNINESARKKIKQYIQKQFSSFHKISNRWKVSKNDLIEDNVNNMSTCNSQSRYGYFDLNIDSKARHSTLSKPWKKICFRFPNPIDFEGKEHREKSVIFVCSQCDKELVSSDDEWWFENERMCKECYKKLVAKCPFCKTTKWEKDIHNMPDGTRKCKECLNKTSFICECCCDIYPLKECHKVNEFSVCKKCFEEYSSGLITIPIVDTTSTTEIIEGSFDISLTNATTM